MAGESARHEYERIRERRRRGLRRNRTLLITLSVAVVAGGTLVSHMTFGAWWLGAVLGALAVANVVAPSQREVAWRRGAEGEVAVGKALDGLGPSTRSLHDLRMPGSKANIDHVLVAPSGVWTVDAKNYTGRLEVRAGGRELWIAGRNRSALLAQAHGQATAVERVLGQAGLGSVPVRPALCFLRVEWPLLPVRQAAGVRLVSRARLGALTDGPQRLTPRDIEHVARVLSEGLEPAGLPGAVGRPNRPAAPRPSREGTLAFPEAGPQPELHVTRWNRYGKRRLYVNLPDGTTLGYVDLDTKEAVPAGEEHREQVLEAVRRYLRDG